MNGKAPSEKILMNAKAKGGRRQSRATDLKRKGTEQISNLMENASLLSKAKPIEYYIKKYCKDDEKVENIELKIKKLLGVLE
jgi:hypothetical protein